MCIYIVLYIYVHVHAHVHVHVHEHVHVRVLFPYRGMGFHTSQCVCLSVCTCRNRQPGKLQILLLSLSSLAFMLPWQFAQFVLLTQQLSLAVVYSLGLVGPAHFLSVTLSIVVALLANIVLQFGNTLLLTSFLPPCLLVCLVSGISFTIINTYPTVKKFFRTTFLPLH